MSTKAGRRQMGYFVLPELTEGKELHLSLANPSPSPSSTKERAKLSCTITKAFRPFTISPVLLVSLAQAPTPPGFRLSLPSTIVLKLYDRRYLSNIRDDWDERRPWSLDKEHSYRRYLDDVASGAVTRGDFDDADEGYLFDNDVSDGEFKAYLQHKAQRLFDRERTTYERLQSLQGMKIPTLYGIVEYEIIIPGAHPDGSAVTETIPGLLLEYIPSVTLWELIEMWKARDPPLPNRILAALCEKAVQIVERISDFDVLNEDVHLKNFLVRQPFVASPSSLQGENQDLSAVEDAVVLIDLGHCRLRREDESEEEWIRAKWSQDEAGAAGCVALALVRKFVGDDVWAYERSLRYYYPSLVSAE